MSVFLRGSTYWCEFMLDGERIRRSTKQRTKGKALRFETNLRIELQGRGTAPALRGKAPLLKQVAQEFIEQRQAGFAAGNVSFNNLRHYENGWKQIADTELAHMRINTITTGAAGSVKFRGGPWAQRACQQVLGAMLNWAAEDRGYIQAAPRIKRTRAYGRDKRLPIEVQTKLLEHMDRDCADLFQIMLDCGLRTEEVLRMRWDDVDWLRLKYFNPHGKTPSSRRWVDLSDRMVSVLRSRQTDLSGTVTEWIFPERSWTGKPKKVVRRHRVTIAKQWAEAREAAGVDPRFVPYHARHEFASSFLEHGGDLPTLQAILGHESIATTAKYVHGTSDRGKDVVNQRNRKHKLEIVRSA